MEGEAVDRIATLAREAAGQTLFIDDREYSTTPLHDPRKKDPEPEVLTVHTLTGLVEYLEANQDDLKAGETLIHVKGPRQVQVVGRLRGHFQQRFLYARAAVSFDPFRSGEWLSLEEMNIALQSRFTEGWDRAEVLRLVGNVKEDQVRTVADDGVTQAVTAKAGVATVENVIVPNPVTLAPFRTFVDVEQPESLFVFRLRKGHNAPEAALFEADAGAWKLEAIEAVADWLGERVAEFQIIA